MPPSGAESSLMVARAGKCCARWQGVVESRTEAGRGGLELGGGRDGKGGLHHILTPVPGLKSLHGDT